MTTNRVLTTIVQLFIAGGALVCISMMWRDVKHDLKQDVKEIKKLLQK